MNDYERGYIDGQRDMRERCADAIAVIRDEYKKLRGDLLDQLEWHAAQGNSDECGHFSSEAERAGSALHACGRAMKALPLISAEEIKSSDGGEPTDSWKRNCYAAIKLLHGALDVIEAIDSECILTGQLKDMVDEVLAARRSGEADRLDNNQSSDGGVEGHAAVPLEIPTQRSGESRDPLGAGSVKVGPRREGAAGIKPGPSEANTNDGGSPGPSPLAVDVSSSDPASGRGQPSDLTLRDWFAGLALRSMGTWNPSPSLVSGLDKNGRALWAYEQADAMLAARAKGGAS